MAAPNVAAPSIPADALAAATRGLVKRYGAQTALQGLDMAVPRGSVYGFLGPNGSGKTTTLRCLVGLVHPDAGQMLLLGKPFSGQDRQRLFRVGSLIEQPAFYPYLSGRDNLRAFGATGGPTPRHRVDQVLDFVGLGGRARDKVKTYSLGMKQRLGIAAALLSDPELLLLDEPANGLDPAGIVAMRELLRYLTSIGKTVIISSHILPEIQHLADYVGIVDRGRLIREGPLDMFLREGALIRVLVPDADVARAVAILQTLSPELTPPSPGGPGGGWITVRLGSERASDVNRLLAQNGIFASGLQAVNDLEQVFLSLTAPTAAPPAGMAAGPPPGWGIQPGAPR